MPAGTRHEIRCAKERNYRLVVQRTPRWRRVHREEMDSRSGADVVVEVVVEVELDVAKGGVGILQAA